MDLTEISCGGVDLIGVAPDRDKWRALVNVVMKFCFIQNAGKFPSSCTTDGLSSSVQLHRVSY
jgi:hypothetical protein